MSEGGTGKRDSSPPIRGGHRLSLPFSPLDERRRAARAALIQRCRSSSNSRQDRRFYSVPYFSKVFLGDALPNVVLMSLRALLKLRRSSSPQGLQADPVPRNKMTEERLRPHVVAAFLREERHPFCTSLAAFETRTRFFGAAAAGASCGGGPHADSAPCDQDCGER